MGTLAGLLTGLAGPLAKKVLGAVGVGMVSYVGVSAALEALLDTVRGQWGALSGDVATLLAMGGVNTAVSIIAGAMVARVALMSFKRLGALTGA